MTIRFGYNVNFLKNCDLSQRRISNPEGFFNATPYIIDGKSEALKG